MNARAWSLNLSAYKFYRITKIPAYKEEESCLSAGNQSPLETKQFLWVIGYFDFLRFAI